MKKIVTLILLFSLFYTASFAQENKSQLYNAKIKQGSILMGGDLSVSYRSFSTYDENDRNIRLTGSLFQVKSDMKGAYFAFNDFGIGAKLSFDHTNFDMDSSNVDVRRTYLLFGPLVRYYLDNGIFGEASIAGGLLNFSRGDKNDLVEGSVGVGYAYFLNNKVSIEPMISFRYFKRNLSDSSGSFDERDYGPFFSIGIGTYLYRDNVVQMK